MPIQLLTRTILEETAQRAAASPRRRSNHNFHSGPADNPHRFFNVLLEGTYVRPHRHSDPPKSETFLILEGAAAIFFFDDDGNLTQRVDLSADGETFGIDLLPNTWHSLAALTPKVLCFEVKPGPWEPATDKEFATWAPAEGDPAAPSYLEGLLRFEANAGPTD